MVRSVKNTLIYWACRIALAVGGMLPTRLARGVGAALGAFAWRMAPASRRAALRRVRLAAVSVPLGLEPEQVVRRAFVEAGRCLAEVARLLSGRLDVLAATELGEASRGALADALSRGRGVVFVTAHLGHFELMAAGLAARGFPIWTIARESYDRRFTALYERLRGPRGVRSIYRGAPGAAAAMLRALRSGAVLGALLDQRIAVPSVVVPVFGRGAPTPRGPAEIALRTGAAVVAGFVTRGPDGRHHIEIRELDIRRARRDDHAVLEATATMAAAIDDAVARSPDQYFGWLHDRWGDEPRTVAPGPTVVRGRTTSHRTPSGLSSAP